MGLGGGADYKGDMQGNVLGWTNIIGDRFFTVKERSVK